MTNPIMTLFGDIKVYSEAAIPADVAFLALSPLSLVVAYRNGQSEKFPLAEVPTLYRAIIGQAMDADAAPPAPTRDREQEQSDVAHLAAYYMGEYEKAQSRIRAVTQMLIAEVGAEGPANLEDIAAKAALLIRELRIRTAGLSNLLTNLGEQVATSDRPVGIDREKAALAIQSVLRGREEQPGLYVVPREPVDMESVFARIICPTCGAPKGEAPCPRCTP